MFARYAADHLFSEIDEVGVRDGANLIVDGYDFAPSFSIWTTIEECLNPPVIWEADRGWFTTPPFCEPEVFDFPEGIGPVECVNVEHEEVLLIPRWVEARRVTFKYGLGDEFIDVLKMLHKLGLDRTEKVRVGGVEVSPRDVVAACLPDPAEPRRPDARQDVRRPWVTGTGQGRRPREVYLYHVVDNEWSMAEYGSQAVVWQTAINPVVALELLARGTWSGAGVLGPEAFDAVPFLDLLTAYGSPWGMREGGCPGRSRLDVGRSGGMRAAARTAAPPRPPAPGRRVTRPRWPAYGASSSSIRSSVPRGSPASAQATMFGMWKSPTLTASASPQARMATSAVHGPMPGNARSAASA